MKIIRGGPEHAEAILDIRQAVRADTYAGYAPGLTIDYLTSLYVPNPGLVAEETACLTDPDTPYWVAIQDESIAGYVKVAAQPRQTICLLHVLKGSRGQGIGSELLQIGLDWLDDSEPVYLEVVQGNDRVVRWYESLGFAMTGRSVDGTPLPSGGFLPELEMMRRRETKH